jgi:hypothetical protein
VVAILLRGNSPAPGGSPFEGVHRRVGVCKFSRRWLQETDDHRRNVFRVRCAGPKFRRRLAVGGLVQAVVVAAAVQDSTPPVPRRSLRLMLRTVPMRESLRNELRWAPADRAAMLSVAYVKWLYWHTPNARRLWVGKRVAKSPPARGISSLLALRRACRWVELPNPTAGSPTEKNRLRPASLRRSLNEATQCRDHFGTTRLTQTSFGLAAETGLLRAGPHSNAQVRTTSAPDRPMT